MRKSRTDRRETALGWVWFRLGGFILIAGLPGLPGGRDSAAADGIAGDSIAVLPSW